MANMEPQLYIKRNGDSPIAYAFGEPWVAQALFMDDIGFSTKEEAIEHYYSTLEKEAVDGRKD